MTQTLWQLPVPSTALTRGPFFGSLGWRQCELSFYVESDDSDEKAALVFSGVEAYKCTYELSHEMINAAYDKLVRIDDSAWLSEVRTVSDRYHRARHEEPKGLQHLMICFDEGPCYEIICAGFAAPSSVKPTAEHLEMWRESAEMLAVLDGFARDGVIALVKVDSARDDPAIYTVAVTGGRLTEAFYRQDGRDLTFLLRGAIDFCRETLEGAGT